MKIGIQVSSDLKKRTGVEEYIYQLLKHLPMLDESKKHHFFIYSRENLKWSFKWGWTQIRLSWEMLKSRLDLLFVPAHIFPFIYPLLIYKWGVHPKLIITIQGLEFEQVPEYYSFWQRKKLRYLTKRNAKKADKIIVPSECTKKDLIKFYKISPNKIFVVSHGVSQKPRTLDQTGIITHKPSTRPYILYLGVGHKRKNFDGLRKAFKILKQKYKIPHELILAGIEKYVGDDEKWNLLKNADVFVFPSFYEGFGFPVLEAQAAGVPVVASNLSSLPEILGDSALLINPYKAEEIAEAIYMVIKHPKVKRDLIRKGQENVKRFSWQKCAQETLNIITS